MSRSFAARFPGQVCGHCDGQIVRGQIVQYVDDVMVHVACPPPPTYCPDCHLMVPASGVCGECE